MLPEICDDRELAGTFADTTETMTAASVRLRNVWRLHGGRAA